MDLYLFIGLLKVSLKIHVMIMDSKFGNYLSIKLFREALSCGDVLHASYYYAIGQFKLMRIPNILRKVRGEKNWRLRSNEITEVRTRALGALFG